MKQPMFQNCKIRMISFKFFCSARNFFYTGTCACNCNGFNMRNFSLDWQTHNRYARQYAFVSVCMENKKKIACSDNLSRILITRRHSLLVRLLMTTESCCPKQKLWQKFRTIFFWKERELATSLSQAVLHLHQNNFSNASLTKLSLNYFLN